MWENHSVFFSPTSSLLNLWKRLINKCTCESIIPFFHCLVLYFLKCFSFIQNWGNIHIRTTHFNCCLFFLLIRLLISLNLLMARNPLHLNFVLSFPYLAQVIFSFQDLIFLFYFFVIHFQKMFLLLTDNLVRICIFLWFTVSVSAKNSKPICIPTGSPV